MPKAEIRNEKIDLRVTPSVKSILQHAAQAARHSVSEFVLESALSRAEEIVSNRQAPAITSAPARVLDATVDWAKIDTAELRYVPCNICGTFNYDVTGSMTLNRIEFYLCHCKYCGLMWRNPLPGPTFSEALYSEQYFLVDKHSPALVDHVGIRDSSADSRKFRDEISQRVVQTWIDRGVQPWHAEGRPKQLLEIGGGRGYLQQAAKSRGWETTGIEISPHGIKAAIMRKEFVLPITIDELCDRFVPYDRYFDVCVFYDFLEHVEDPARVLRMIRHLLADDGFIIFRVPNTIGLPTVHLIDHLWHFSAATLPLLLSKEAFKVVGAHLSGIFRPSKGNPIDNITVYAQKTPIPTHVSTPLTIDDNPLGVVGPVPHT